MAEVQSKGLSAPTGDGERAEKSHFFCEKQEGGLCALPKMHASSCVSPSAAQPPGSEEKNAEYKIKTKVEKLVTLGIESHLLLPVHGSP